MDFISLMFMLLSSFKQSREALVVTFIAFTLLHKEIVYFVRSITYSVVFFCVLKIIWLTFLDGGCDSSGGLPTNLTTTANPWTRQLPDHF